MQDQQNQDSSAACELWSGHATAGGKHNSSDYLNFSEDQQQQNQGHPLLPRNGMFSNQIDFLAVDSFQTLERGSLQLLPELNSFGLNSKMEEDLASTLKSSQTSLMFQEQENQEEEERKLIIKTQELTLKSSMSEIGEDLRSEASPRKIKFELKKGRGKGQHLKHPRQLVKQLKKQYKFSLPIKGDAIVTTQQRTITLKSALFQPVISEKGHLSGLIIRDDAHQLKIRVGDGIGVGSQLVLELWDDLLQGWSEFSFKVRLHNI